MPRALTDEEKTLIQEAIIKQANRLIREKGLRAVTVSDITDAVGIAKGSFYHFFDSREVCLYETIRQSGVVLMERMTALIARGESKKQLAISCFREVILAPDSLLLALNVEDYEIMMRKLPAQYREKEQQKEENSFGFFKELFELDDITMETFAQLMNCLEILSTNKGFSKYASLGKERALDILVEAIAELVSGGEES